MAEEHDVDPLDSHESKHHHGELLHSPAREMLAAQAGAVFGQDNPEKHPEPVPVAEVEEDEHGAHLVTEDGDDVTSEDTRQPREDHDEDEAAWEDQDPSPAEIDHAYEERDEDEK